MALTSFPLQSALLLFATCLGLKTVFYVQRHVFLFETLKKKIPSSLIGGHVSQFCSGIFMLPFIKTPCFHCRGEGLIPGRETKIPHAVRCSQRNN